VGRILRPRRVSIEHWGAECRRSAQDQKVKPVGSGLRASRVPGVLPGAAEPFLAPCRLYIEADPDDAAIRDQFEVMWSSIDAEHELRNSTVGSCRSG